MVTSLRLSVAVVVSLVLLLATVSAVPGGGSGNCNKKTHLHFHRDDAVKLTRSKLYRFRQQCKRENLRKRRGQLNRQHEKALQTPGSFLSLSMPTPERVSRWFGGGGGGTGVCGRRRRSTSTCSSSFATERRVVFNHDTVGMTNPCLHVRENDVRDDGGFVAVKEELLRQQGQSQSQHDPHRDDENNRNEADDSSWWPSCAWLEQQQQQQQDASSSSSSSSSPWRVLRYHRQVGIGSACYEKTKEAALAWEFADRDCRQGLLSVTAQPTVNNRYNIDDPDESSSRFNTIRLGPGYSLPAEDEQVENDVSSSLSSNVVKSSRTSNGEEANSTMIWSQGGRRLATFTRCSPLRCFFAVNPVAVVYDIVDQQGGPGGATTFTSTAYATCKGHWFRGEERVTVALRRRGCPKSNVVLRQQQGFIHLPSCTTQAAAGAEDEDDDDGGVVDVEILSISKPGNSIMGRVAYALSSRLQHRFFVAQLDALERQAQQQQPQQQQQQEKTNQ